MITLLSPFTRIENNEAGGYDEGGICMLTTVQAHNFIIHQM